MPHVNSHYNEVQFVHKSNIRGNRSEDAIKLCSDMFAVLCSSKTYGSNLVFVVLTDAFKRPECREIEKETVEFLLLVFNASNVSWIVVALEVSDFTSMPMCIVLMIWGVCIFT